MTNFIWNGKPMVTVGDISDAMSSISDKAEALAFREAYRATNEYADQNIGYLTGYYDRTEMQRLQELFDVGHPIFGRSNPTNEEVLTAGMTIGRIMRDASS